VQSFGYEEGFVLLGVKGSERRVSWRIAGEKFRSFGGRCETSRRARAMSIGFNQSDGCSRVYCIASKVFYTPLDPRSRKRGRLKEETGMGKVSYIVIDDGREITKARPMTDMKYELWETSSNSILLQQPQHHLTAA
jgi:hypothetical protein